MKTIALSLLLSLSCLPLHGAKTTQKNTRKEPLIFSLNTTKTWREYPLSPTIKLPNEKWALTSQVSIKSKDPIRLKTLRLRWKGGKIQHIHAALYQKKHTDQNVIPIQQNLIADGIWNARNQELLFNVDEKVIWKNTYYLLLSFPNQEEVTIKKGSFVFPGSNPLSAASLTPKKPILP